MFKIFACLAFLAAFSFEAALGQDGPEEFVANESRDDSALEVGVDFAQQDPFMSDLYQKGPYLLYDCESMHWVCAGRGEFNRCVRWRSRALKRGEANLSCAHFVPFDSRQECHKKQIEMTNTGTLERRFCLHPKVRRRQIDY
ncbi:MAG: hypothetical protein WD025_06090 [Bacteriovoracaceae bacterium]